MAFLSWLQQSTPFNPLLFLLFPIFLYAYVHTRCGKLNLPPSPPKLPIIGNLHQLGTLPHRSLQALSKRYGPLMLLKLGHVPTLVVSSAGMAREMVKRHDVVFSNRPKTTASNNIFYGCKDVLFSPYGEYWRQVRKICVLELLSVKSVKYFQHVRDEEVQALTKKIHKSCLKGDSINLSEMLATTSNNIVSRCVCGKKFEQEDGKSRFARLSRRVVVLLATFCFGDFFPSFGWIVVLTGCIRYLKAIFREFDTFFDQLVEEHKIRKHNDDEPRKKDLTNSLLKDQKNRVFDIKLSESDLRGILIDMIVAGTDSTSTTLEWLMAELLRNPTIMKRAQEEVRRVVGKKSKIEMNDIDQMDYLKCIIKETLRLHPPAPLSLPRETSTSIKYGGYDIPPKARVFLNVWAIQRDPTIWERPEEFLPERFKDNPIDFKGQHFEFLPFGSGRRSCPGLAFGIASVEYVVANILCWFDWRLPYGSTRGEDLDMGEVNGAFVAKKIPLHLVPVLQSS